MARRRAAPVCRLWRAGAVDRREAAQPLEQRSDRCRRWSVARLTDRRVPATREALARPDRCGIAEDLLEGVPQDDIGQPSDDRVADRRGPPRGRWQVGDRRPLGHVELAFQFRRDELAKRGEERDRGRFGEGESIEFVAGQPADTLHDRRDKLSRGRRPAHRSAGGAVHSGPRAAADRRGCRSRVHGRTADAAPGR